MHTRSAVRATALVVLTLLAACRSDAGVAPDPAITTGDPVDRTGPQTMTLEGGSAGADYVAVLVNTSFTTGTSESFTLRGSGLVAPSASLVAVGGPSLDRDGAAGSALEVDHAFEARIRAGERSELTPRFAAARAWSAERTARALSATSATSATSADGARAFDLTRRDGALPAGVRVGDIVTLNVNGNTACTKPVYHGARVAAIGTHAVILADTLNPANGFTDADFRRYAARFDSLVFPLDSAAFGAPTDVDANGHIGLIFTRAVNELTPAHSSSYVGGFTFSRDLFPAMSTSRAEGCAASNQGEFFYLLAPDPSGAINGNVRTTGFVDSNTTAVIAHEFQHLINAGRRIYVNDASTFEETWLDEGLAHIAEELLFYREAGLAPESNLDTPQIRALPQRRGAFNLDMLGNSGRYRTYLLAPSSSSPYAANDALPTRGAAWSLLRYLADRSGIADNAFFYRLANSTTRGIANVRAVYGEDLATAVRDWSASHAVDDVAVTDPALLQPSWNWHSMYPALYGSYPLQVQSMADGTPYARTVIAGGAAYFRLGVPAGGSATLSLGAQSTTAAANLRLVLVRTR